ncbi:MAG TPA: response regulator [Terriglobia bacterium]|nr:response regulator [Terriglobia bacterium]
MPDNPHPTPGTAQDAAKPQDSTTALRILLVEDNAINQTVAVRLLEKQGYRVRVARNGREALAALEKDRFDLVLMDLQMPEMDGFEATRAIRQEEQGTDRHLPIIAMTAHAMKGDREKCLAAGMDDYLSKPIQKEKLFETVAEHASRRSGLPLSGAPAGGPSPAARSAESATGGVIDLAAALEHLDGDLELLAEGAGMFLEDCPVMMSAVQQAVEQKDSTALMRAAHSLKGSLATFAARPAVAAALRLELMGRQGSLVQADAACRELEAAVERLKPALADLAKRFTP